MYLITLVYLILIEIGDNTTSTNITNNGNGDQYNWRNENFKPSYFTQDGVIADDINSSLTKGTAYIKVDFRFKGWPSYTQQNNLQIAGAEEFPQPTDQLGVSWLAYLQYRPNQTAAWIYSSRRRRSGI